MSDPAQDALVEQFYTALRTGDVDLFWRIQHDRVAYNMSGHTVISGRIEGKDIMAREIVPYVFAGLRMADFEFDKCHRIMCSDGNRVVAIMEADGFATNGVRYDQRYVHMFGFRDGLIAEVWEFFDTKLADAALFTPEASVPRSSALTDFQF